MTGNHFPLRKTNITNRPLQPEVVAAILWHLPEDDALDLLLRTAQQTGGPIPKLNRVGLLLHKPDEPVGEEAEV